MFSPKKLHFIYLGWFILMVSLTVFSMVTGEYQEMMGAAVDLVPQKEEVLSRDEMIFSFMLISIVVFVLQFLIGWLLLFHAVKKRIWAVILFTIFTLGMAYYLIDMAITLPNLYPDFYVNIWDQLLNWGSLSISLIIFSILVYGVFSNLNSSNNTSTTQ